MTAVAAQLRAGGASEANLLRARVLRDEAGLVHIRREQELAAARVELAALWGGGDPAFTRASGGYLGDRAAAATAAAAQARRYGARAGALATRAGESRIGG